MSACNTVGPSREAEHLGLLRLSDSTLRITIAAEEAVLAAIKTLRKAVNMAMPRPQRPTRHRVFWRKGAMHEERHTGLQWCSLTEHRNGRAECQEERMLLHGRERVRDAIACHRFLQYKVRYRTVRI